MRFAEEDHQSSVFSSPHAEMMRKRNSIIFNLVESEREYVHQLEILVANYVRPFRMGKEHVRGKGDDVTYAILAASSKKPPVTHEDINSIFLNRFVAQLEQIPSSVSLLF